MTVSSETLVCWKCGAPLMDISLPLSRRAVCGQCGAELHVCRMCEHYNPRVSEKCDEPAAEHPRETERANFCDYLRPQPGAYKAKDETKTRAAKSRLDALFGSGSEEGDGPSDEARAKLDGLFSPGAKDGDESP